MSSESEPMTPEKLVPKVSGNRVDCSGGTIRKVNMCIDACCDKVKIVSEPLIVEVHSSIGIRKCFRFADQVPQFSYCSRDSLQGAFFARIASCDDVICDGWRKIRIGSDWFFASELASACIHASTSECAEHYCP